MIKVSMVCAIAVIGLSAIITNMAFGYWQIALVAAVIVVVGVLAVLAPTKWKGGSE